MPKPRKVTRFSKRAVYTMISASKNVAKVKVVGEVKLNGKTYVVIRKAGRK